MNLIIGLLLLATTANAVHVTSSTKIELTQEQKRKLTEQGKAMFLDNLKQQKDAIVKTHAENVKKGVSVEGKRGNRALTFSSSNNKFMDGFSEVVYGFSGPRCTGNVIAAKGNMSAQPSAIKARDNSLLTNCRYTPDGFVATLPSQCEETTDGYKTRAYHRVHQDSHCKDTGTPVWGDWNHFDKCNEGEGPFDDNYYRKDTGKAQSHFHACTKNQFPFNNNDGMYYFFYAPGTCGKKESPQYFQSVALDNYCQSTKGMMELDDGFKYLVNGINYKYNPKTQMLQMKMYLENIPQSESTQDFINNLGFKGGDMCSSDIVYVSESPMQMYENLYECESTGEIGEYTEMQLQYMDSDGKITTVHSSSTDSAQSEFAAETGSATEEKAGDLPSNTPSSFDTDRLPLPANYDAVTDLV